MSSEYEKPKISIVVPVYNKAKYISRTLDSLCTQTLSEIEIICVDDASSDNSLEIIHQYADTDSRIKVISFSENHTANTARKAGVMQANGEYIMLMDADDTLRSEACESLYEKMNNSDIDILNFGINVINCGAVSEAAVENAFNFLSPFLSEIFGTELFVKAVDEEVCGGHALWNKIYRHALLKTAFEYVEDLSLLLSEDLYVWFIIAYFAKSYKGISDVLYDYYYGLGVTGHHRVDLTRFEKTLIDSKNIVDAIERFLNRVGRFDEYEEIYLHIREKLLFQTVRRWYAVPYEESSVAFDKIPEYWEPSEFIPVLARRGWNSRYTTVKKLYRAKAILPQNKPVKTVGLCFSHGTTGEVHFIMRSLAEQMKLFGGVRTLMIYDEEDGNEQNDNIIYLPSASKIQKDNYTDRNAAWKQLFSEYRPDVVIFFDDTSRLLLWDMLTAKLNNVKAVIACHSTFSKFFKDRVALPHMMTLAGACALSDGVLTFEPSAHTFWSSFSRNCKAVDTTSLISAVSAPCITSEHGGKRLVVCCISQLETAAALDALEIFRRINMYIPDVEFVMLTENFSQKFENRITSKINDSKMDKVVHLQPLSEETCTRWNTAALTLHMAACDMMGFDIMYSMSAGVPTVSVGKSELHYPYMRDCQGVINIDYDNNGRNINIAVEEMITLLRDEEKRQLLGKSAQDSICAAKNLDALKTLCMELLTDLQETTLPKEIDPMWDDMFDRWISWLSRLGKDINKLKNKLK